MRNPAAPEEILLQEKEDDASLVSQQVFEPEVVESSKTVEPEEIRASDEATPHHQRMRNQWLSELCDEWNMLTSGKKTALQMLFGFALLIGIILFAYGLVS